VTVLIVVFPMTLGFEVRIYDEQNFLVRTSAESDGSLAIYLSTLEALGTKLVISSFVVGLFRN
jgi:hypothetical protein